MYCFKIVGDACVVIVLSLLILFWSLALIDKTYRTVYNMPNVFLSANIDNASYCWLNEYDLELQEINTDSSFTFEEIREKNKHLLPGGSYSPNNCVPFQDVAIIIPYRNREKHLKTLLNRLHPMLERQKLKVQIFVIEQDNSSDFNRGMLMNIGAIEALKLNPNIDCFVFHDVDLLPEHDRNIYLCDESLRGFTSAVNENRYHLTYENYGGGVTGLSRKNFFRINGFPNAYWGWGSEDDDYSARTDMLGLKVSRPPVLIGRYTMVRHVKAERTSTSYNKFSSFRGRHMLDGLSSLFESSYKVTEIVPKYNSNPNDLKGKPEQFLFTRIQVSIPPNLNILNDSIIAIATREEIDQLNLAQSNNKPAEFPPKTMENLFWFLHFYGWLGF